jgi:hypothetical protein
MLLSEEFDRLIEALEREGLDYALAGGLAVAVWGAPRATRDIDLLVHPDQLEAVGRCAGACGFAIEAEPMIFRDGMELRRLSKAEGGDLLTLDLLLVDPSLAEAWRTRQRVPTRRGRLWVVSREALIGMKARAARPQDIFDIERLKDQDR